MERDRPRAVAAASAIAFMRSKDLDFLCVQEAADYLVQLHDAGRDEFRLIAFTRDPGRRESAIVVRRSVPIDTPHQVRMTTGGWFTVRGGKTPPKYLTTVQLDGWLRVASGHTAPSVRWPGGRIVGPVLRVLSMRQFARRTARFARRRKGALLIACDWNATPATRGRWSPHWIARKAGLRVAAPGKPTFGRRVIDFALYKGCSVTARREKRRGSDHYGVVFTVSR